MLSEVSGLLIGFGQQIYDLLILRGKGKIIRGEMGLLPLQILQLFRNYLVAALQSILEIEQIVDLGLLLHQFVPQGYEGTLRLLLVLDEIGL
jgi:hypothetical protein